MTSDKLTYYITEATGQGSKESAYAYLEGNKNSLANHELAIVKAHVNTFFMKAEPSRYDLAGTTRSPIKKLKWFSQETIPSQNWVCSTLGLRPGPVHILNAFSNVGKTFLAANLAACVAHGQKLFGSIEIENPGPVLHIDWDQGEEDTTIYYWKILNGLGINTFDKIDFLFKPEWNLSTEFAKEELTTLLGSYRLCIIDCFGAAIPGEDINDERVRQFIDLLNTVSSQTKCTILLLHHEPKTAGKDKTKAVKGNGSIISGAGGSIHLARSETTGEITLALGKKRLVKDFSISYCLEDVGEYCHQLKNTIGLRLVPTTMGPKPAPSEDLPTQLLRVIKASPGIHSRELRQSVDGFSNAEIDKAVDDLASNQMIAIAGQKPKKHTITEAGEAHLAYH